MVTWHDNILHFSELSAQRYNKERERRKERKSLTSDVVEQWSRLLRR
jgi:hypothetical protein